MLKNEFLLKSFKFEKVEDCTKVKLATVKELLRLAEGSELQNLFFWEEKPFLIQQHMNKLSGDRVYLKERLFKNLDVRLASTTQKAAMVMVWLP